MKLDMSYNEVCSADSAMPSNDNVGNCTGKNLASSHNVLCNLCSADVFAKENKVNRCCIPNTNSDVIFRGVKSVSPYLFYAESSC